MYVVLILLHSCTVASLFDTLIVFVAYAYCQTPLDKAMIKFKERRKLRRQQRKEIQKSRESELKQSMKEG